MTQTRTQVVVIGGGPAGLTLSHILDRHGIDNVVLERQSKEYVLSRIRAGVLEPGSVQLLRDIDLSERMDREGNAKDGTKIVWQNKDDFFIDTKKWTGRQMMAYGQTNITEDLYAARERDGASIITEAVDVSLFDVDTEKPYVTYEKDATTHRIDCDFMSGCDGYQGPSRQVIPQNIRREYERVYPFGWLGIMVERPPL